MTSSSHVITECQTACKFTGKPPKCLLQIVQIHKSQVYLPDCGNFSRLGSGKNIENSYLPPLDYCFSSFETKRMSNKSPLKCVGTETTWNKPIITYLNQAETRKIESTQSQKKNCTPAATLYTTAINIILKIFLKIKLSAS